MIGNNLMTPSTSTYDKPLVGFFPLFYNLAETGRAVIIAKRYMEQGGRAIFFSHGGEFEKLAQERNFDKVKLGASNTAIQFYEKLGYINTQETYEDEYGLTYIMKKKL